MRLAKRLVPKDTPAGLPPKPDRSAQGQNRRMSKSWDGVLNDVTIDPAVHARYPEYVAVLMTARGLEPGEPTPASEALLRAAEASAATALGSDEPHDLLPVAVWRAAYASFGVKPREGRSSVEALLRRAASGLPRIDRLTDTYNAVSVLHLLPIGGEDLRGYFGPPRLSVADGTEVFDTVANGEPVVQHAEPGEVIWCDNAGVTCRRWNWRQCVRTRLSTETTDALFIIDSLGPDARERAESAAHDLRAHLSEASPSAVFTTRIILGR